MILTLIVAGAVGGQLLGSRLGESSSTAQALLRVHPQDPLEGLVPGPSQPLTDPARLVASEVAVLRGPEATAAAARRLGLGRPEDLTSAVTVVAGDKSDIITITAHASSDDMAVRMVRAVTDTYLEQRTAGRDDLLTRRLAALDTELGQLQSAISAARSANDSSLGTALATRYVTVLGQRSDVATERLLGRDEVVLAMPAQLLPAQSGTAPPAVLAGGAVGAVLGLLVAYAWKGGRKSAPVLVPELLLGTLVPPGHPLRRNELVVEEAAGGRLGAELRELFALVSHRLVAQSRRRLGVMSMSGRGITCLVAVNFAEMAARDGLRVLLVAPNGWSDEDAPSAWRRSAKRDGSGSGGGGGGGGDRRHAGLIRTSDSLLDILETGGATPGLSSARFTEFLDDLEADYDLTILIGPSLGVGSGSTLVAALSGACLVLTDGSHVAELRDAIRRIRAVNADVVGVVVTQFEPSPSAPVLTRLHDHRSAPTQATDAHADDHDELDELPGTRAVSNKRLSAMRWPAHRGKGRTGGM